MSLAVVDLKNLEIEEKKEDDDGIEPEDLLWKEITKLLERLEKGVDGDLSALSRTARSINKFRKRFSQYTWSRLLYTLIPNEYKNEFESDLLLFCDNWGKTEIILISKLCGVNIADAQTQLNDNNGNVRETIINIVKNKELKAKNEIIRKRNEIKKEKEEKAKLALMKARPKNDEDNDGDGDKDIEMADKSEKTKDKMDTDKNEETKEKEKEIEISLTMINNKKKRKKFYFETYIFIKLLICYELYDRNDYKNSLKIVSNLIERTINENRRTCDLLSSNLYSLYSLLNQRTSNLNNIRNKLYQYYQTSCLQQNMYSQSVLINLILQNYIKFKLYQNANKFVEKSEFPDNASSAQIARYNFYRGVISTIKLDYNNAFRQMQQGLRRAPQYGAFGFKIKCTKWLIAIQLLLGDIPDKTIFVSINGKENKAALIPYQEITNCVREGNIKKFNETISKYESTYLNDGLIKVLLRLKHNVIKTGLKKINKSYSKISLKEIQNKLLLDNDYDAYFIVSKAIKDGIINAKIDFRNKFVESRNVVNVYSTSQPYYAFADRVRFCLDIYTQAIKSLKYPNEDEDDLQKKDDDEINNEEVAEIILNALDEDDD